MMIANNRLTMVLASLTFAVTSSDAHALAEELIEYDYNRDIRPVLSGKCFHCHGPDAAGREADLRLDQRDAAIEYDVIVPGAPEESILMDRILTDDPYERMPPKGEPLSKEQVVKIAAWIRDGAPYEEHWSFQPPQSPNPPAVETQSWPTSQIDYFILKRIEKAGLKPSPEARPAVLLRRLYLDLIGLPPSVEEVSAFEANHSAESYEAQVDRLLESKHFGEKWAAGWLDLARYADSNGYQHDDLRSMWPYRDWVINALNDDMPFDRFTIEQLAGDLLPNPSTSQLVATGFNRNVAANFSGGSKVPEVRANILHDRVATTGSVWLGLTLECAQCHDHKFDAISQQEYFQFYAYFNQAIPEVAQQGFDMFRKLFVGREVIAHASEDDRREALKLRNALAAEEKKLLASKVEQRSVTTGAATTILGFENVDLAATNQTSHPATVSASDDVPEGIGTRSAKTVVEPSVTSRFFGTGFTLPTHDLSEITAIEFWIKTDIQGGFNFQVHNEGKRATVFRFSTADVKPGTWTRIRAPIDSFKVPSWSPGAVNWSQVEKLQVTAFGDAYYAGKYVMLSNVVGVTPSPGQSPGESPQRRSSVNLIEQLREQLAVLETPTMVMQDSDEEQVTHIMIRGDYASPGERVEPGTMAALHPPASDLPRNRLGLARWLVDPKNPLTPRVTVNRIWAEIMGRGIVATPDDFGMQGDAPSHPELLDWLAIRFIEQDWSIKKLIKTIVMSTTYRQTSAASDRLLRVDPRNEFYARGPRFRLTSELVRDNLLKVSGLLSDKLGGAVVYPPQPSGLWKEIAGADVKQYPTSVDEDRFRRGIYTVWRRGNPYPSMITFDSPDRSKCTAQRDRSNTPLQALTLLNDPVYVEMAMNLSREIESWHGSDREKVIRVFRRAIARTPSDEEVRILLDLHFARKSWFPVVQALMNLDEAITKS
ncbi:MAG: PSD1 and planctomycete cytochrome C domain-containing protein [Planctomycetota bacterium]